MYGTTQSIGIYEMLPNILVLVLMLLISGLPLGFICRNIARRKGYKGGAFFALGFFTNAFGLLVLAALPLKKELRESELREAVQSAMKDQSRPNP